MHHQRKPGGVHLLMGALVLVAALFPQISSAQTDSYTLRITFRGIVDFVTDGTETPTEAWFLMPDMRNPSGLPLKDPRKITAHKAVLLVDGVTTPPTYKSCHAPHEDRRHAIEINDYHVTIDANVTDPLGLLVNRALRDGAKPSTSQKSIEWLADMGLLARVSSIDGKPVPLRSDLLNPSYSGGLLASRVYLKRGKIRTSSFVLKEDGDYVSVPLPGFARAMGHSFEAEMTVSDPIVLTLRPLDDIAGDKKKYNLSATNGLLHIIIENEVGRDSSTGECLNSGDRDFAAHYVLRQDSDELEPFIPVAVKANPNSNPQCSPADNSWP